MGDLADRRGLAGAVHADHQHDMGMRGLCRARKAAPRGSSTLATSLASTSRTACSRKPAIVAAVAASVADARGHGHAEIGLDQHLFELVEHFLVELRLVNTAEIVGERRGGAGEPLAKPANQPFFGGLVSAASSLVLLAAAAHAVILAIRALPS